MRREHAPHPEARVTWLGGSPGRKTSPQRADPRMATLPRADLQPDADPLLGKEPKMHKDFDSDTSTFAVFLAEHSGIRTPRPGLTLKRVRGGAFTSGL